MELTLKLEHTLNSTKWLRRRQNTRQRRHVIVWRHIDFCVVFFLTNLETSGSRISAEYDAIHTKSYHIKTYRNKLPIS